MFFGCFAAVCVAIVVGYGIYSQAMFIARQDCILDLRNANDVAENAVVITGFRNQSIENLDEQLTRLEETSESLEPDNVNRQCGPAQTGVVPW